MFESLDLPVLFEAEVVVAGGGPAGIAAALAAAAWANAWCCWNRPAASAAWEPMRWFRP